MTNNIIHTDASRPLHNHKHEKFAQSIANGMTQAGAYVDAGYQNNKSVAVTANKFIKNTLVSARIEFLKQATSDAIIDAKTYTAREVWEELLIGIRAARKADDHKAAAELTRTAVEAAGLDDPLYTRKAIFEEKVIVEGGVDARSRNSEPSPLSIALDKIRSERSRDSKTNLSEPAA